ncbi:MAG: hypothetical protein WD512_14020 [Candidatus Paceibacterota bacterium]
MLSITEWLEEQETTSNIQEAIFILDDGTLIDGGFDMGMRGIDHNCIISLASDSLSHSNKWDFIHETYNIIRLVPETKMALIMDSQELNKKQLNIVNDLQYEVEYY